MKTKMIHPGDYTKICDSLEGERTITSRKWNKSSGARGEKIHPRDLLFIISVVKTRMQDIKYDVLVLWNGNLGWIYDYYLIKDEKLLC